MDSKLASIYYDVRHPASFGTVQKLRQALNNEYDGKDIAQWLRAQDAHTLHRQRRLRFSRSRYFVPSINNLFQTDLCDMRNLATYNKGYKFILTVIDVFSQKAWAVALKNKKAETVVTSFRRIFEENTPKYLQSDKGKEFTASKVQKYLKDISVKFYTTNNPNTKAAVIERFNKTLKTKMYKYFTHASTLN
jgi:transposase InsO family protein